MLEIYASIALSAWPFGELRITLLRAFPSPNDLDYQKCGTQTTQKSPPREVQFYNEFLNIWSIIPLYGFTNEFMMIKR